jgi:hypothetical protein
VFDFIPFSMNTIHNVSESCVYIIIVMSIKHKIIHYILINAFEISLIIHKHKRITFITKLIKFYI